VSTPPDPAASTRRDRPVSTPPDPTLERFLLERHLAEPGEPAVWSLLAGGVSSDIWCVDLPGRSLCVKRALPRLKVAADWQAPVSRNAYEWAWLRFAAQQRPANVPEPLAHDAAAGVFAMRFLDPVDHPVWKAQLLAGTVAPAVAAQVGAVLAALHQASAGRAELARAFDSDANFHALRLEPYLLASAERHADLAPTLRALVERTASTRVALVHGDISPKNILVGPQGPVLLDAECAWYGDPAFDVAFCLNHLLLKGLVLPARRHALLGAFDAFVAAYCEGAAFEPRRALEARAATLLPGLLLARIDGKSPVEYLLARPREQALARDVARRLLGGAPVERLADVREAWRVALEARSTAGEASD
jgi:aminoglycoside phosphotransferase (APT) family kinase protein